jgi:hypothetical protein
MLWTPLPTGQTVHFKPGYSYHVVATVKTSHTDADIVRIAIEHGLLIDMLASSPADGNYRMVVVDARATRTASIPWSAPGLLSIVDSSAIVEASEAVTETPSPSPTVAPPAPSAPPAPPSALARAAFLQNIVGLIGRGIGRLICP